MTEIKIKIPYGTIAAKTWGNKKGKPTLLLHGWLDNASSFDLLAPLLSPDRYLVAIDLPGHGKSSHLTKGFNYHLVDSIGYLYEILNSFQWKECDFIGHSLGGGLLALFAGSFPSKVHKAVFIEALGPLSSPEEEMPERITQAFLEKERLAKKKPPLYSDINAAALRRHQVGGLSLESARILTSRSLKKIKGGFTWRSDPRLKLPTLQRLTEKEVLAFLKNITAPSLLIYAQSGYGLTAKYLPLMKQRVTQVKNIQTVEIEGSHHLHMDNPSKVAQKINRFL